MRGTAALVVGGGAVALRKAATLVDHGAAVTVIGVRVSDGIKRLPVIVYERPYRRGDTRGYRFVYAATDDTAVNARIARESKACGAFVNVCDDPLLSDFVSPAVLRHGICTVAVSSNGRNVRASIALRHKIQKALSR